MTMLLRPIRSTLSVGGLVALMAGVFGCTDQNAGDVIPADQLYYPFGMVALDNGGRVAVLSTNADQRFLSQQVSLLDTSALIDAVLDALGASETPEAACDADGRPLFADTLNVGGQPVVLSRVRVPGIGSEIVARDDSGEWMYVTDRLDTVVYAIRRSGDTLSCARDDEEERLRDTDCSLSFQAETGSEQPFSLGRGTYQDADGTVRDYLAVGHLGSVNSVDSIGLLLRSGGLVTFLDEAQFISQADPSADIGGAPIPANGDETVAPFSGPLFSTYILPQNTGVSGIAFSGLRAEPGRLLTLGRSVPATEPLLLAGVEVAFPLGPELTEEGSQEHLSTEEEVFSLGDYTNARESHGMVLYGDEDNRALISLRFRTGEFEIADTYSSGLAVLQLDTEDLGASRVVEVGEELGKPAIRPYDIGDPDRSDDDEPILAYIGDFRADKIWIVDVTRDEPRVVGEITGRQYREVNGRDINARTLDTPREIVFVPHNGRMYGLVSNFENSTMAVLDVGDPQPQRHCLLARVGRDIDANGESEGD